MNAPLRFTIQSSDHVLMPTMWIEHMTFRFSV